jgi:hypothetical protein
MHGFINLLSIMLFEMTDSKEGKQSLKNAPFCPIPASGSNFNPRNTQCIPACPVGPADRTGVANPPKFGGGSPSLDLKKIEHFSKVSKQ